MKPDSPSSLFGSCMDVHQRQFEPPFRMSECRLGPRLNCLPAGPVHDMPRVNNQENRQTRNNEQRSLVRSNSATLNEASNKPSPEFSLRGSGFVTRLRSWVGPRMGVYASLKPESTGVALQGPAGATNPQRGGKSSLASLISGRRCFASESGVTALLRFHCPLLLLDCN